MWRVIFALLGAALFLYLWPIGGRFWEYRPFGDLEFTGIWGHGIVIDTREKEKLLDQLRTGDADERALAVSFLLRSQHGLYKPQVEVVTQTLTTDPEPRVRSAAAWKLAGYVGRQDGSEASRDMGVLRAMAYRVTEDPDPDVRDDSAYSLVMVMDTWSRRYDRKAYLEAARVLMPYARQGTTDEVQYVARTCQELVGDLEVALSRTPTRVPGAAGNREPP
ncbi:MAG TPA: HEAT repeat domain-containing protein [Armatimonadota bacterium]|nr:HEAT repeat domain-containing protein [Armatimonadota bacterium]